MTSVSYASESGDEVDVDTGELSSEYFDAPLQLSDIMPKNRRLYDKMRPPKFKGKSWNMRPPNFKGKSWNMKKGYRWYSSEGSVAHTTPQVEGRQMGIGFYDRVWSRPDLRISSTYVITVFNRPLQRQSGIA